MKIENSVALVTGSNRGLGLAFAKGLLARGAKKVYAAARDPKSVTLAGVVPLRLDVTSLAEIAAAAREAGDVTLLVNNAGIARPGALLANDSEEVARAELETNYFGPLRTTRAFAPILAKNGGGAIINVLSAVTWVSLPHLPTYSASKSAAWSLTNATRDALRGQRTQVLATHPGYIDTDMAKAITDAKSSAEDIVKATLDALEAGHDEVLPDAMGKGVKAGFSAPRAFYLGNP